MKPSPEKDMSMTTTTEARQPAVKIVGNELRDAVRTMLSNVKTGDDGHLLIRLEDFNRLSELARQPRGARPLIDQPDKD